MYISHGHLSVCLSVPHHIPTLLHTFFQRWILLYLILHFLWPPCIADADIVFLSCFFLLSSFSCFFSSPNLSGRRLDVCHTSTHGVALVRIQNAGLKCTARGSLKIQDAKKSPSRHHRTTSLGGIVATKACINNWKKLVKQQYLLHVELRTLRTLDTSALVWWVRTVRTDQHWCRSVLKTVRT